MCEILLYVKFCGDSMKNYFFYFICLFSIFLINCTSDPWIETEIEIKNESAYNLHITFKKILPNSGFNGNINLNKEESYIFWLEAGHSSEGVKPRNPNNENVKINVFDSDTKRLLKEMSNEYNLFEFIKSDNYMDYYLFKITDVLLSMQ